MTLIPEIDTFACVLLEAARACPAGAIVLVDSDTGDEVDAG